MNKTNNDFISFLNALIYEDFTNYYSRSKKHDQDVYSLFNKLNEKYRKIAFEKEVQHAFLQTIIKHINIGVLVMDNEGGVVLVNSYFLRLLNVNSVKSIKEIKNKSAKLQNEIENIESNKPKLLELILDGELYRLSVNASHFKLDGISYKLVSLQDINIELDEQEINAWQKLIRVLTHEIMNSVTPISSLASSLNKLLTKAINNNNVDPKHLEYLSDGLNAVQNRSEGLIKFTEAYKKLTQVQYPDFKSINIHKLFENVILLHKSKIEEFKIEATISVKSDLNLLADKSMIEQIMINLIKNSIQALEEIKNPIIQIKGFIENKRVIIQVIDNGKGIPEDKIDKIFIPFFTTKDSGSGIGLSFARQVMRLHKGVISVKSVPENTIFTLKF
ncbi:MAG: PAS domain-containing protein [Bacteroidales bacterium]|nr:PAS domain-containing protein [Bacteroidales bacterium]